MKDLSTRLNEEVANATKAAKRDAAKLQARVNLIKSSSTNEKLEIRTSKVMYAYFHCRSKTWRANLKMCPKEGLMPREP